MSLFQLFSFFILHQYFYSLVVMVTMINTLTTHFLSPSNRLSPSGCTFWGKKPWSRKKKILWQLGTLVGAPVGIALIAGIAIPAMIIGIPVYVGRKVRANAQTAEEKIAALCDFRVSIANNVI